MTSIPLRIVSFSFSGKAVQDGACEYSLIELAPAESESESESAPGILALAQLEVCGTLPTGRRLPAFQIDDRVENFWKAARAGAEPTGLYWSYASGGLSRLQLTGLRGSDLTAVDPQRHALSHGTALALPLGDQEVLVIPVGGVDPDEQVPFRLSSDRTIFSNSHVGRVGELQISVAVVERGSAAVWVDIEKSP